MTTSETPGFVRLRVEMVLEIIDADALTAAALESIAAEYMADGSAEERTHAEATVRAEAAEALASLIDPFDLISEVPGVDLAQASWSSETIDYDPDAEDWADGEDDNDGYFEIGDINDGDIEDNETEDRGEVAAER